MVLQLSDNNAQQENAPNMRHSLLNIGVLAAAAILLAPTVAMADGTDITLRAEPGVAVPLTQPQTDRFGVGGDVALKPTYTFLPYLDGNVTFSLLDLSSRVSGVSSGTAVGVGGGLRLKGPHDASNAHTGLLAWSPWVDGDVQYVRTGPLDRAAVSVGVGAEVPLTSDRVLWAGPFARFLDIPGGSMPGMANSNDARVLIVGLTVEIGGPVDRKAPEPQAKPQPKPPVDHTTVTVTKDAPPPPKADPVETHVTINEKVPFPFDSAVPLPEAEPALKAALQVLLAHADLNVEVDGHASNEGRPWAEKHNQALSAQRAQAVADWLVKNGVPASKLVVRGFGTSKPLDGVAPSDPTNRRVEFDVDFTLTTGGSK